MFNSYKTGANVKFNFSKKADTTKKRKKKEKIEIYRGITARAEAIFALTVGPKVMISIPAFNLLYNARKVI